MPSLRQFRQFLAVAETMSFRRAAQRLNMAQPPLTAAIRQMEAEIGARLLERSNRITDLTPAGRVLEREARIVLDQAERALALTRRAAAGLSGSLRIGFVASAVRHVLPRLIARFRETHPAVALELAEAPSARQIAALREERLDLGIVVLPLPPGERRVATRTLLRSELVLALPAAHPLAAEKAPQRLAALAEAPWILFPPEEGPGLHGRILRGFAAAGFAPLVAQRAVQMETILGLVAAGLGVAVVPALFRDSSWEGVAFRGLTGPGCPIRYEVALAFRRDDASPVLAAFLAQANA